MPYFDIPYSDELVEKQKEVYGFDLNKNLLINGAAGSGKTLLALYRARQLEKLGKKVLFIVYTKTLKAYVENGAEQIGLENTTIATIQDLSEESIGYRVSDFDSLNESDCLTIINNNPDYKHVIIDEGQDFSIYIYRNLFRRLGKRFTICVDDKQRLYSEHDYSKDRVIELFNPIEEKKLNFTIRNPRNVLKLAIEYYRKQFNTTPAETRVKAYRKTDGEVKLFNTNDEIATLRRLIKERDINTIGILLPRAKTVDYISNHLDNYSDVEYEKYHTNLGDFALSFNNDDAKIIPYWSSKGIQFDIVIIPFISRTYTKPNDNIFNPDWEDEKKALFVAMTRTKEKLFFVKTDNHHFPYENSLDNRFYERIEINEEETSDNDEGEFIFDDDLPF